MHSMCEIFVFWFFDTFFEIWIYARIHFLMEFFIMFFSSITTIKYFVTYRRVCACCCKIERKFVDSLIRFLIYRHALRELYLELQ